MRGTVTTYRINLNSCLSMTCLFDGYLIKKYFILEVLTLPITVFIAVLGNGLVNTLQNGSFWYCRIAVFFHKSLFPAFSILSLTKRFFTHFSSQGHSIGHFVLDSFSAFKRHFYRTFSLKEPVKSYLIDRPSYILNLITSTCISTVCLFDGYLIEALYRAYKIPKPLDQSGFFSPLSRGQRDKAKIAILNR